MASRFSIRAAWRRRIPDSGTTWRGSPVNTARMGTEPSRSSPGRPRMPIHLMPPGEATAVSRRDFLAGLAAVGSSLAIDRKAKAAEGEGLGGWYALVADTHVAAD